MGSYYISPKNYSVESAFRRANNFTPIIIILSKGFDIYARLSKFADKEKAVLTAVSLGKGQEEKASEAFSKGLKEGYWVMMQNCHLFEAFMDTLKEKCKHLKRNAKHSSPNFRLILTSMPSEKFPESILADSVKITIQQPRGVRANMLRFYTMSTVASDNFKQRME